MTTASPSVGGVEEKRQLILTAALGVLVEKGYARTRLRDVADRAGVSVGLIQHYFDSRENLLAQAMLHSSHRLLDAFGSDSQESRAPWRRVTRMIALLASVPSLDDQARLWLESSNMVMQYPHLSPLLQRVYDTWHGHLRAAIAAGVDDGSLDPVASVDEVVAIILAFIDGYEFEIATGLADGDPAVLERRALTLAAALVRPATR